ncbi:MAG: hypothetical protein Q8K66_13925 [Sediminibacterium sp.]|nr:hypothetical protein [Sediminibacterium sp.]
MSQFMILPTGSHLILLNQAIEMTKRYRENKEAILAPEYKGQNILSTCETFNKDQFLAYLSKVEVAAFRIYSGMSDDLRIHSIIVGVDKDGKDILPSNSSNVDLTASGGQIFEDGLMCPPICPPLSDLNP